MQHWLTFAHRIDGLNERIGRFLCWVTLAMVLVGAYNTLVRYAGRWLNIHLSSNAYLELQWYLFSLIFLLGAAYTLRHNAHVRVDVLYGRLSPRTQAWINLVGTFLFLIPFCAVLLHVSWSPVWHSWNIREMSSDPGGLPRYPIKAVIPVAFLLVLLQGISEAIKNVAFLRGHTSQKTESYQPGET